MHPSTHGLRFVSLLIAANLLLVVPTRAETYLSMDQALALASGADPAIQLGLLRQSAAQAAVRAAGIRPSAALGLEIDNFAGTGPYGWLSRNETTLSYEQVVERVEKREARTEKARSELEVTRISQDLRRLDFIAEVQKAYIDALAAQAALLVAEARLVSSIKSQDEVERRVKSARDPLFAGSRAEAVTAQAEISRDRARAEARASETALAAYLGGLKDFTLKLEDFFDLQLVPMMAPVDTPDIALLEAERSVALAALRVEKSRDSADPKLGAGVRYFGEGNEVAFVLNGSIPLGARVANRANVERAEADHSAAAQTILVGRARREREINNLVARIQALGTEANRIRDEVIPFAIRTVDQVTAGFARGGFEYADVVEAQRALVESRSRRVDVLRDYHSSQANLDRLTGKHLHLFSSPSPGAR